MDTSWEIQGRWCSECTISVYCVCSVCHDVYIPTKGFVQKHISVMKTALKSNLIRGLFFSKCYTCWIIYVLFFVGSQREALPGTFKPC